MKVVREDIFEKSIKVGTRANWYINASRLLLKNSTPKTTIVRSIIPIVIAGNFPEESLSFIGITVVT